MKRSQQGFKKKKKKSIPFLKLNSQVPKNVCLLGDGTKSYAAAAASTCLKGGIEICRTNWTVLDGLSEPDAGVSVTPPPLLFQHAHVVSRVLASRSRCAAKAHIGL